MSDVIKVNYTMSHPSGGSVMTVQDFRSNVKGGMFVDSDGYGNPSNGRMVDPNIEVVPSKSRTSIPSSATHIVWYKR